MNSLIDTRKYKIGIDVDETIVSTKNMWKKYVKEYYNIDLDFSKEITDSKFIKFWHQPNIYDNLKPITNTDKYINDLYNYYKIIFISDCVDEHIQSKYNFLKRYFKFDAFINTPNKDIIDLDYIIDDRPKFLTSINHKVKIQIKSELPPISSAKQMNWDEIYEFLTKKII